MGPECYKQNFPVWVGAKIEFDNQYSYNFYPNNGDTIQFNFAPTGDTNTFYRDNAQKFALTYENSDTITILNYADSARFYTIHHTDLDGNSINSVLNGQKIIIGKALGLVRFFQIDEFPVLLNPIALIGQKKQNLGIHNITYGMIYDFQLGDEFQYEEAHYSFINGYPPELYTLYRKHTITERTETNDSLFYKINQVIFYEDSSGQTNNIITKAYAKNKIIAQLPFEKFNGDYRGFSLKNYCDLDLWTYRFEAENALEYCAIDDVWGYYDTFGPPTEEEKVWAFGLGVFRHLKKTYLGNIMNYYGFYHKMIYYKKGDNVCGSIITSTPEIELGQEFYQVFPNPVNDLVSFKNLTNSNSYRIEIRNALGQVIKTEDNIAVSQYTMNVASLKAGIYLYVIKEKETMVQQGKLIKK